MAAAEEASPNQKQQRPKQQTLKKEKSVEDHLRPNAPVNDEGWASMMTQAKQKQAKVGSKI